MDNIGAAPRSRKRGPSQPSDPSAIQEHIALSGRVTEAAKAHLKRFRGAMAMGGRLPTSTTHSTPRGHRVISALTTPTYLRGLIASPSRKQTLSVVLSQLSGQQLNARIGAGALPRQTLYTWRAADGSMIYVGVTQQTPGKRLKHQELKDAIRRGGKMSPEFLKGLAQGPIFLHLEDTGEDRGKVLWEEISAILIHRPPANRSIAPTFGDFGKLATWLNAQPNKAAMKSFLFSELAKLRVEQQNGTCPFGRGAVTKLQTLISKVK